MENGVIVSTTPAGEEGSILGMIEVNLEVEPNQEP
jgi:hypothetical protein